MLVLPKDLTFAPFLSNMCHYQGLRSLNGHHGNVADITSRLAPLRRSSVLAWLCGLSGFLSDSANRNLPAQLHLSRTLLPDELDRAYHALVEKEKTDIGGPGWLFHAQQLRFLVQLTVMSCTENVPETPAEELRSALVMACLIANDVIQDIDSLMRPFSGDDANFNRSSVGVFLPLSEVYADYEMLPRSHLLWFECASCEPVRKKADELGIEGDFESAFAEKYQISLREFFLFLFALRIELQANRAEGRTSLLLDTNGTVCQVFDAEFVPKAFSLIAQTCDSLALRLLGSRQSWTVDISPLRERPLIYVFDDKLCCPDILLLQRTVFDRIYFLLSEAYPPNKFQSLFGFVFEEYIYRLISEFAPRSTQLARIFYRSPRFDGTTDQAGDAILHLQGAAVIIEMKATRLTTRSKYGGSTEELVKAIKDFLVSRSSRDHKGAAQIAKVLKRVMRGDKIVDGNSGAMSLADCPQFYPLIVTAEETVGSNSIRRIVQQEFDAILADEGIDASRIKPVMILTIRDFELLESAAKTMSVKQLLEDYSQYLAKQDANPIGGFQEFLYTRKFQLQPGLCSSIAIMTQYSDEIVRRYTDYEKTLDADAEHD